jgi:hypothetical protein
LWTREANNIDQTPKLMFAVERLEHNGTTCSAGSDSPAVAMSGRNNGHVAPPPVQLWTGVGWCAVRVKYKQL